MSAQAEGLGFAAQCRSDPVRVAHERLFQGRIPCKWRYPRPSAWADRGGLTGRNTKTRCEKSTTATQQTMMKELKTFMLRMDPALHEALEAWAQQEMRSLNGQIEFLLKEAVAKRMGADKETRRQGDKETEN